MKTRLSIVGWVFLLMMGVSLFGYSFISLFGIQDYMLQNGLGTVLLGLPAVLYLVFQEKPNKEKVRFHLLSWKAVLLLLVIAVGLELVTIEINVATSFIFSSDVTDSISTDVSSSTFAVSLFCIAVLPAVFEELSFRGAFFQEYRDAYGGWVGVLISGFMFGLYHMNMRQFVYAFLCGILFALLIEATDSIASSMLMHFLMNAISCVAIYASSSFTDEAQELTQAAERQYLLMQLLSFFPVAVFGLVLLVAGYIFLAKCCGRYDYVKSLFSWENLSFKQRVGSRPETEEGKAPWRWIFSIPFILSVAFCIFVILVIEIKT